MPASLLSDRCHEGLHFFCAGDAWDHLRDEPTGCQCGCHEDGDD